MKDNKKSLLDILPNSERAEVEGVLRELEQGNLDSAYQRFQAILDGNFSQYSQAFAFYGIGVIYSKRIVDKKGHFGVSIDIPIKYLERSLEILEHADAHLMLAILYQQKLYLESSIDKEGLGSDNNLEKRIGLIRLIEKAINHYLKACELNRFYVSQVTPDLESLKIEKFRLENIIAKELSERN